SRFVGPAARIPQALDLDRRRDRGRTVHAEPDLADQAALSHARRPGKRPPRRQERRAAAARVYQTADPDDAACPLSCLAARSVLASPRAPLATAGCSLRCFLRDHGDPAWQGLLSASHLSPRVRRWSARRRALVGETPLVEDNRRRRCPSRRASYG